MSVAAGHPNRDFDVSIPTLLVEDMVLKWFSSDLPNAKLSLCNALEAEIRELRHAKPGHGATVRLALEAFEVVDVQIDLGEDLG